VPPSPVQGIPSASAVGTYPSNLYQKLEYRRLKQYGIGKDKDG
jgi:hypothetical protein